MPGLMAPPQRYPSRPLMLAATAPIHVRPGLMNADASAFSDFDLHEELTRLLWAAVVVLAVIVYLGHIAAS
jgi:hypothetical protein